MFSKLSAATVLALPLLAQGGPTSSDLTFGDFSDLTDAVGVRTDAVGDYGSTATLSGITLKAPNPTSIVSPVVSSAAPAAPSASNPFGTADPADLAAMTGLTETEIAALASGSTITDAMTCSYGDSEAADTLNCDTTGTLPTDDGSSYQVDGDACVCKCKPYYEDKLCDALDPTVNTYINVCGGNAALTIDYMVAYDEQQADLGNPAKEAARADAEDACSAATEALASGGGGGDDGAADAGAPAGDAPADAAAAAVAARLNEGGFDVDETDCGGNTDLAKDQLAAESAYIRYDDQFLNPLQLQRKVFQDAGEEVPSELAAEITDKEAIREAILTIMTGAQDSCASAAAAADAPCDEVSVACCRERLQSLMAEKKSDPDADQCRLGSSAAGIGFETAVGTSFAWERNMLNPGGCTANAFFGAQEEQVANPCVIELMTAVAAGETRLPQCQLKDADGNDLQSYEILSHVAKLGDTCSPGP